MIPHIDLKQYDYELPEERIAKYPLPERDMSKLLVYRDGQITDSVFSSVDKYLPADATLVFNDTKVIRARLHFNKETGANIEIFCLEPIEPAEIQMAFVARRATTWKCIVGNSKKWKSGALQKQLNIGGTALTLRATRVATADNTSEILFEWSDDRVTFSEIIDAAGTTPIPPYLNRETEAVDTVRYQTVYSEHKGSVAAPTAGLHFTEAILDRLKAEGHEMINLTLHVGAGTFKPVQTADIEQHLMHTEHIVVDVQAIRSLAAMKKPVVAVGTTSVRTLESLYWMGVRLLCGEGIAEGVAQWDPYRLPQQYSAAEALTALADKVEADGYDQLHSQTQIMIVPGYKFRIINALITNFHQPHSTLLLLIGALVGLEWKKIYRHALDSGYRFLSYGDSSVLYPVGN
ncbi:MAG: S-adenosylmethionine:tRNA ribosyltransferase-isomerase [Bacteroidales bacterium]|nr:S-adenosylmethionine:tRNA ribosyltransferase-isomerase [Bacteroidales bacterium]